MKKIISSVLCFILVLTCAVAAFAIAVSADSLCVLYYGKDYMDSTVSMTQSDGQGGYVYPFSYEDGYARFEE